MPKKNKLSSYAQKLKDPRWTRRKTQILTRDDFTCQECQRSDRPLHIHHEFYLRAHEPWEYKDEWLVTLCEVCHENREKSIEALHQSLLGCSTGELLVWSQRIRNERQEPKRRMSAAAPKKVEPEYVPADDDQTAWEALSVDERQERGRRAFQRLRESLMAP